MTKNAVAKQEQVVIGSTIEQLLKKVEENNPLKCSIVDLIKLLEDKANIIYRNKEINEKGEKLYESMVVYKMGVFYAQTINEVESLKKYR